MIKILQLFTIESDNIPFLIVIKELNEKENLRFPEFVRNYACPDYHIKNMDGFLDWLLENQSIIFFLFDGLDEASFSFGENIRSVNIDDLATAATWVRLLLGNKIMKNSTIIFTSRPSSLTDLPFDSRPDKIYSLNGFEGESLRHAVQTYNSDKCDEIVSLIDNLSADNNHFLMSPLVVSLISLIYQSSSNEITAESTLTQLYQLAFEERRKSVHNRLPTNETNEEKKRNQELVDDFFYNRFINNNLSNFTAAEVEKCGLSIQQIENNSFVTAYSNTSSSLIENNDVVIEVKHLTITVCCVGYLCHVFILVSTFCYILLYFFKGISYISFFGANPRYRDISKSS